MPGVNLKQSCHVRSMSRCGSFGTADVLWGARAQAALSLCSGGSTFNTAAQHAAPPHRWSPAEKMLWQLKGAALNACIKDFNSITPNARKAYVFFGAHWVFWSHQKRVHRPLISLFSALDHELETSGWNHWSAHGLEFWVWCVHLGWLRLQCDSHRWQPFGGNKTHLSQIKTGAAPGRCWGFQTVCFENVSRASCLD